MNKIKIEWKIPIIGSVLDVESTHYDASKGELITAGFLSNDGFTILQRMKSNETDFKVHVGKEMEMIRRPLYAFQKECEEGFCGRCIDHDLQLGKEAAYVALKNEGLLEHYNSLCDPLSNDEIPDFWETWKQTQSPLFLSKIVRHNYCCLAKEYYLKLKRVDKFEPNKIIRFLSSAAIEKLYIRPSLKVNIGESAKFPNYP